MNSRKAMILDIQRFSTEDGPGLRTTVFFKQCNLRCIWCQNPESLSGDKQIEWNSIRCIGCGLCVKACQNNAIKFTGEGVQIDRLICKHCEDCVKACPTMALIVKGIEWELNDLVYEVLKDRNYFGPDGGITISGGESLLQIDFVAEFLSELKREGIHTAVDTAGLVSQDVLERVLPNTDLVLFDLKIFDQKLHKKYTGSSNTLILKNVQYIAEYCRMHNTDLWIRTPVIPGITDSKENISHIGKFIREYLEPVVSRWELLTFNNLCRDKYERLNMDWKLKDAELLNKEKIEFLHTIALESGVRPEIVKWTGVTNMEVLGSSCDDEKKIKRGEKQ